MAWSHVILVSSPHSSVPPWFSKSAEKEHMPRVITTNFLIKAIHKDYTFGVNFSVNECNFTRLTPHKSWWGTGRFHELILSDRRYRSGVPFLSDRLPSLRVHINSDQAIYNWQIFASWVIKLIDPRRFLFPAIKRYHCAIYFLGFIFAFRFYGFFEILQKSRLEPFTRESCNVYLVNSSPLVIKGNWRTSDS